MIGYIILFALILVFVGMIWLVTSRHSVLDDVLRERVDYDMWLRRNEISEEKERETQKGRDAFEHDKRMAELKKEVDKIEGLLRDKK